MSNNTKDNLKGTGIPHFNTSVAKSQLASAFEGMFYLLQELENRISILEKTWQWNHSNNTTISLDTCFECGMAAVIHESNCDICKVCGHSQKCSLGDGVK
jgi:hypothetical protein